MKRYVVRLTEEERCELKGLVGKGRSAAYKICHAHILLQADADGPGWLDEQIAAACAVHLNTVANVRRRCVEQGLAAALERKPRETPPRARRLDGEQEAHLIALSCSPAPEGRRRWTLHLLADKLVELRVVDEISHETVRQALKKTR